MSDENNVDRDKLDEWLVQSVRTAEPRGPVDSAFWEIAARRGGIEPSEGVRARALGAAAEALAIGRGELTLGRYLTKLRRKAKLSVDQVAGVAKLAPELIADVEGDRWPVINIPASRLAKVAVRLGATKRIFLDLVRMAPTTVQGEHIVHPTLARTDPRASLHDEEDGGVAESQASSTEEIESYVAALASAFDAEAAKTPPASTP